MRKSFFKEMLSVREGIKVSRNKDLANKYISLRDSVLDTFYTNKSHADVLASMSLEGYSCREIGERLGITEVNARNHVKELSDQLYAMYSEEIFSYFRSGMLPEIDSCIRIGDYMGRSRARNCSVAKLLFPVEVYSDLNSSCSKSFDVLDCQQELDFLRTYCLQVMRDRMDCLDKQKVAYLFSVLSGEQGSMEDRTYLYSYLLEWGGMGD